MLEIKYEIKLNESGRPYIDLPPDFENKPEHNFFIVEMTRYLLLTIHNKRSEQLDGNTSNVLSTCINFLGQISDEVAELLWYDMKAMGDIELLFGRKYHLMVDNIEERDKIEDYGIFEGKIYKKEDGLKVFVTNEMKIYEFKDENWIEL